MDAKEQCERLMNGLLPVAQHLLEKNREFYPVGAVMLPDDTVVQTAAFEGNDHPDSQDVINALIEVHRKAVVEENIKASGIAYNASVMIAGKKTDCIVLRLEHQSGYSVTVGVPYTVHLFKKIRYGDICAMPGTHSIFDAL